MEFDGTEYTPEHFSMSRCEKIPEAEFDRCSDELTPGWKVLCRKDGYVYIVRTNEGKP